ncbi:MAG: hypothetical protein J6L84_02855 [Clostridiales bacterium]|nr:hypothetical protein [Clostridiales bacterium]MBP3809824.1 hypothetical protein [Clostridiales bacterium]
MNCRDYQNNRRGSETGIYIVCSDKGLLDKINNMLRFKGIIGVADAEGKFHYFVDGRKRMSRAITKVEEIVTKNAANIELDAPESMVVSALRAVLIFYDFDMSLIGTTAMYEIIRRMVIYRDVYYHGVRELYGIAADRLKLSYEQTERDIRYTVKKSSLNNEGMKTTELLRFLADEVIYRLEEMKRQPV